MQGDAGVAGFVAKQVEVVEDVLGVQGAAVGVEDVAGGVDVAEGAGVVEVVLCVISAVSPRPRRAGCTRTFRASSPPSTCGTTDGLISS